MRRTKIEAHRILVVDDSPGVRDAIKMLLTFDGHDVETAENGSEALARIKQDNFDLILTDFSMPAMTGEELAIAVKSWRPKQPVGMITAYASMLQSSGQPVKGVDFLISKPFDLAELRAAINSTFSNE